MPVAAEGCSTSRRSYQPFPYRDRPRRVDFALAISSGYTSFANVKAAEHWRKSGRIAAREFRNCTTTAFADR
jgi:hypothetical protein